MRCPYKICAKLFVNVYLLAPLLGKVFSMFRHHALLVHMIIGSIENTEPGCTPAAVAPRAAQEGGRVVAPAERLCWNRRPVACSPHIFQEQGGRHRQTSSFLHSSTYSVSAWRISTSPSRPLLYNYLDSMKHPLDHVRHVQCIHYCPSETKLRLRPSIARWCAFFPALGT